MTGMVEPSAAPARTTVARNASVSVIIPTWNEAKYLPALLDSLQNQTQSPSEILVADSASTDGTQDLAEAHGALFDPNDVAGCAAAILRCLRDRDSMQEAARDVALTYSVDRCTRRLERVYERLVAA